MHHIAVQMRKGVLTIDEGTVIYYPIGGCAEGRG